ncbi:hypothetical protein ABH930_005548 [Kitasatospora sp. GAS204A]|nr:hypothetical protein [Kitasatospora sp. GAS204B]
MKSRYITEKNGICTSIGRQPANGEACSFL